MNLLAALERHGDRPAIERADGTQVTYRELLARARRHASPNLVEVPAERSVDFIARCLGAWLGGGAFFPIDPADPRPRPSIPTRPDLAYVISTSGSTGAPKHVLVSHRGLPALLTTQIDAFALSPGARSLWLHSPLFDASISDWGTALVSGATLVIPTTNATSHLRDELASRAITHVDLPPSLLAQLASPPPSLCVVVLGGEPCPVDRVRALAQTLRVVVVYGPTEATVCSSLVVVDAARWSRPLIGHPLPGITYHVIDGELHIAGDALALGYVDRDATAHAFIDVDGTRMYCTGDRVEPTEHGLAFIGRIDRQRKLRGRRIELDEVESVLLRFADNAAVIVRDDRLVAFVDRPVDRRELRTHLPGWMMPARIVVGALPRTSTGKIDRSALERRALPTPQIDHVEPHVASLARAWCQVLGVDGVTDDDRFSEMGGDSLARLSFLAATEIEIDGDPTFGDLVEQARVRRRREMTVAEAEARGRSIAAEVRDRSIAAEIEQRHRDVSGYLPESRRRDIDRASTGDVVAPRDAILITGATGYLGRAIVDEWRRRDARPIIALARRTSSLDRASTPHGASNPDPDRAPKDRDRGAGSDTTCTSNLDGGPDSNLYKLCLTQISGDIDRASTGDIEARRDAVLITGATGMLGRAIVDEWRRRDVRPIIALVRGAGSDTTCTSNPDSRPDSNLYKLCLTQISNPWLGLGEPAWHDLRGRVSTVIHCAAAIRLGGDWDDHVDANVRGTAEVVAFAAGKALHHISTLSVFVSTDRARGRHAASDNPHPDAIAFGGYAQTKIAAEGIARDAGATVYRLGLLVDEARIDDQRAMTMRGLAKLGAVPAGCGDWCHDVTPVEHAARVIVEGVLAGARGCHHVSGGERVTVAQIAERLGLDEIPMAVWRERARERIEDADIAMARGAFSERRDIGLFLATGVEW